MALQQKLDYLPGDYSGHGIFNFGGYLNKVARVVKITNTA